MLKDPIIQQCRLRRNEEEGEEFITTTLEKKGITAFGTTKLAPTGPPAEVTEAGLYKFELLKDPYLIF